MSLVLPDSMQVTLHAAALEADGLTADPNAKVSFSVDNSTVVGITDNGDGSCLAVAVSDGSANVTATASDPDGNVVSSQPFAITVVSTATDTRSVAVTADTPVPKS